ncbi:MAG: 4-hydroxybenzoate 3-monooxygenase [Shimia sp.]
MRTQVAIIGGGPSGLLLGQLLATIGVESVVLERRSEAHVLSRIRAGVLERGLFGLMHEAGVAARMEAEGFSHDGCLVTFDDAEMRLPFTALTGHAVTVYGQTELTRDLYEARRATGSTTIHGVEGVTIQGADTEAPAVTYTLDGTEHRIEAAIVAGCDGFHGVSRETIPKHRRREVEKVYPFGWLGILSETPPVDPELIYASSERGFALCSMRNARLSRYYIQVPTTDRPEDWSDAAFWDALRARIPARHAEALVIGPSIEKSIAPLRSFVCEPMRWGRLFLVGDAAHIVPPTGAKGLNTAASDVHYLFRALTAFFAEGDAAALDTYSDAALARVWQTQRFSWWFSRLLHHFPDEPPFHRAMQRAEFETLATQESARRAMAENYVGLPY